MAKKKFGNISEYNRQTEKGKIRLKSLKDLIDFSLSDVDLNSRSFIEKGKTVYFHLAKNKVKAITIPEVFNMKNTKLCSDVKEISLDGSEIDNFNLKLNKYVTWKKEKEKEKAQYWETDKKGKIVKFLNSDFSEGKEIVSNNIDVDLKKCGYELILETNLTLDSSLVIGLGNPSVYETSMTLHHIYGVPYIPGSALKGVCRHYFIYEVAEKENPNELKIAKIEEKLLEGKYDDKVQEVYNFIFGTQDQQGKVVFFDSFPDGDITLKADIMTPHYGEYYRDGKPPADYLSPTPIPFLTVQDTEFKIMAGIKKKDKCLSFKTSGFDFLKEDGLLGSIKSMITNALTEHGIGAKTAVGYGYFQDKS
jgi:CRISPR-associated protein Cmr6